MPLDNLAANLKRERYAASLTRAQLASRAGVSAETIGRIERGETTPNPATLAVICRALGVEPRKLVGE